MLFLHTDSGTDAAAFGKTGRLKGALDRREESAGCAGRLCQTGRGTVRRQGGTPSPLRRFPCSGSRPVVPAAARG